MEPKCNIACLPRRPLKPMNNNGQNYRKVNVITNLRKLNLNRQFVNQYAIACVPQIAADNRILFKKLLKTASNDLTKFVGSNYLITGKTIYEPIISENTKKENHNFNCQVQGTSYSVTLKYIRTILVDQIKPEQQNTKNKNMIATFINIIVKNLMMREGYKEIGKSKNFYNFKGANNKIRDTTLELYQGYSTNTQFLKSGLYLQINTENKIINRMTVLQKIKDIYTRTQSKDKNDKRNAAVEFFRNKIVMANYGTNQFYRVEQLMFDLNIENIRVGENSLLDYYRQRYNIVIESTKQPLVKSSKKNLQGVNQEIFLFPELLLMCGIPDDFDERKRVQISNLTIKPPQDKIFKMNDLVAKLKRSNNQDENQLNFSNIQRFGIRMGKQNHRIDAKQLEPPQLLLGCDRNGQEYSVNKGQQAFFNLFDKPLYSTKIQMNLCLCHVNYNNLNPVISILENTAKKLCVRLKIQTQSFYNDKEMMNNIEGLLLDNPCNANIFWFLMPRNSEPNYKKIKRIALQRGIYTQVSLEQKIRDQKKSTSVITKILLQMNAKIGNVLWVPSLPKYGKRILMISVDRIALRNEVGFAYVSTLNREFNRFASGIQFENEKQQSSIISTKVGRIILKCVDQYMMANNNLPPQQIVYVREGCSEGQKLVVLNVEVVQAIKTLNQLDRIPRPKLTFICIDKKPKLRFYKDNDQRNNNPPAGTLINQQLISPDMYDFYLIAQQARNNSSAIPTYYKVLHNESDMDEQTLQKILFSQCFNYANWSGSLKLPSTLQYAARLSRFLSKNDITNISDRLNNSLYFI